MCALILIVFVIGPLTDLWLLVQMGERIGIWPTLGWIVATALLGSAAIRAGSTRLVADARRELVSGRVPGPEAMDGVAALAGGVLLIAPGILTDALGLLLLFRPTRRLLGAVIRRWLERQVATGSLQVQVLRWQPGQGPMRETREDDVPLGLDPSKEIRLPPPDPGR